MIDADVIQEALSFFCEVTPEGPLGPSDGQEEVERWSSDEGIDFEGIITGPLAEYIMTHNPGAISYALQDPASALTALISIMAVGIRAGVYAARKEQSPF